MSTAMSSYILIIDLTGDKPKVLRRFDHHRLQDSVVHNRIVKGRVAGKLKGGQVKPNGHAHANGNGDVDMGDPEVVSPPEDSNDDEGEGDEDPMDEDADSHEDESPQSMAVIISVDRIAISTDGQWLATSDNHARTHIFNLDSISVRSSFPIDISYYPH